MRTFILFISLFGEYDERSIASRPALREGMLRFIEARFYVTEVLMEAYNPPLEAWIEPRVMISYRDTSL